MSLKEKINLTKMKTAEFFNKKKKTIDPNFLKRMQYVQHMNQKVNDLFRHV